MVEQNKTNYYLASAKNLATQDESMELKEIERLERRYRVAEILRKDSTLAQADGSMLRWTTMALINSHTKEDAVKRWKAISHRQGKTIIDFSAIQQKILFLPTAVIEDLHDKSSNINTSFISKTVENAVYGDHGHRWNDAYEIRQKQKRSLDLLRKHGIRITVTPVDIQTLQKEYTNDAVCPILDQIKNKKIALINGFPESKMSLTIHDIFDHFWTYDMLEREGILDRYKNFLQSVGNPQATDIFKREGELIASVTFEWRSSHTSERQFKPPFDLKFILRLFERIKSEELTDNQRNAFQIIKDLDPQAEETIRLGSIYTGILIELMEQRRKHGFIRKLDDKFQIIGNLPLIDLEYLSLIIEVNHLLCEPKKQTYKALINTEALVEDYLIALVRDEPTDNLIVKIADIETFDLTKSRISSQRQRWLNENPFHTATRMDRCDD